MVLSLAGACRNRTHQGLHNSPTDGFEVQDPHFYNLNPYAPIACNCWILYLNEAMDFIPENIILGDGDRQKIAEENQHSR